MEIMVCRDGDQEQLSCGLQTFSGSSQGASKRVIFAILLHSFSNGHHDYED